MLYNICNYQEITVSDFRKGVEGDFFRRRLHTPLVEQRRKLETVVNSWPQSDAPDEITWALGKKKKFTTKSVYEYLEKNVRGCDYKWIWASKIPLKIQIFLWQLFQDAILTRDVMSRRNWAGNPTCSFCDERETSQHLFFTCPVAKVMWRTVGCVLGTDRCPKNMWQYFAWCYMFIPDGEKFYTFGLAAMCWALWNCRNKLTFEYKQMRSPFEVVYSACGYLNYWTGLMNGADREAMERGAKMLKTSASTLMCICAAPGNAEQD